jgi:hypothetical protein
MTGGYSIVNFGLDIWIGMEFIGGKSLVQVNLNTFDRRSICQISRIVSAFFCRVKFGTISKREVTTRKERFPSTSPIRFLQNILFPKCFHPSLSQKDIACHNTIYLTVINVAN